MADTDIRFASDLTVRLISSSGGDHMIVAAAKVSTSGEAALEFARPQTADASRGLIRYLMRQRHGTPFEHSSLTFFVHAPIFVWREWHRHRIGFSYNEESGRYKTLDPVFYLPPKARPMFKVNHWKPGQPRFLTCDQFGAGTSADRDEAERRYRRLGDNLVEVYRLAYARYLDNLDLGIDPGLARDCLPVGIYSSCWVTCNPRSLMAFLSLRTHDERANHPSYPLHEIEQAARACEAALRDGWPLTYEAFCEFGREAP